MLTLVEISKSYVCIIFFYVEVLQLSILKMSVNIALAFLSDTLLEKAVFVRHGIIYGYVHGIYK